MDHNRKDLTARNSSPAPRSRVFNNDDDNDNASSDTNEVDYDKNDGDSFQDSPKCSDRGKVQKKKVAKASAKFLLDKKKLEQYVGEGELLVPVPRARRRLKGNELGYMVKRDDVVLRYIDKEGVVYNQNGE